MYSLQEFFAEKWKETTALSPKQILPSEDGLSESIQEVIKVHGDEGLDAAFVLLDKRPPLNRRYISSTISKYSEGLTEIFIQFVETYMIRLKRFFSLQKTLNRTLINDDFEVNLKYHFSPYNRIAILIDVEVHYSFIKLLQLVIPAQIAGVKEIVLFVQNDRGEEHSEKLIGIAKRLGISEMYRFGGRIGLFAAIEGTETINKCDKVFGDMHNSLYCSEVLFRQMNKLSLHSFSMGKLVSIDRTSSTREIARLSHLFGERLLFVTKDDSLKEEVWNPLQVLFLESESEFDELLESSYFSSLIDLSNDFKEENRANDIQYLGLTGDERADLLSGIGLMTDVIKGSSLHISDFGRMLYQQK